MAINYGTVAPAATIAERKQQLRELYELSGVFTFDRERDDESDIYFVNTSNQSMKARLDYRLKATHTTSISEGYCRSYCYKSSFDDSAMQIPPGSDRKAVTSSYSTQYSQDSSYIVDYNQPFNYIYINQPFTKFLKIKSEERTSPVGFMIGNSESGKSLLLMKYTGEQLSDYIFGRTITPLMDARQWYAYNKFTIDGANTHDRLIQHYMPHDIDSDTSEPLAGYITADPLPEHFTFTRQASLLLEDSIYHDEVTGIDYYSPTAEGTMVIKLT